MSAALINRPTAVWLLAVAWPESNSVQRLRLVHCILRLFACMVSILALVKMKYTARVTLQHGTVRVRVMAPRFGVTVSDSCRSAIHYEYLEHAASLTE